MKYNCQSNIGKIESILLKQPKDAFINQDYINANWKDLNYTGCPDYNKVVEEFEFFVELLKKEVSNIYYLPKNDKTGLDSIYPHDPVLITKKGAILCNMGKKQHQGEPTAVGEYLTELGIPILGSITGGGSIF